MQRIVHAKSGPAWRIAEDEGCILRPLHDEGCAKHDQGQAKEPASGRRTFGAGMAEESAALGTGQPKVRTSTGSGLRQGSV